MAVQRQSSQTGGHDIEFVRELDEGYKCPVCTLVLRSPFQTVCGHRFCETCIKPIIESGPKTCPIDNSPLTLEEIFRDVFCNREILDLECRCERKHLGCQWTGQLRKMEGHRVSGECLFVEADCLNDGCDVKTQRRLLEDHMGKDCHFKKEPSPHCVPRLVVDAGSTRFPTVVAEQNMDLPQNQALMGATKPDASNEIKMKKLEDQALHTSAQAPTVVGGAGEETMALERRVTRMEHQHTSSDVQMAEFDVKISVLEMTSDDGAFIWKIEELGRRIHEAVTGKALSIYSTPFFVGRFGYKVCARVYLNGDGMGKGTHLSLFFVVMRGMYDAILPWPFQQKVSFKLVDQSGDQHIVDSFRPDPNSSSFQRPTGNMNDASGCPLFVPKSVLHSRGYIKDESLFFKITVDPTGIPNF